jgi:hypothetical protein
MLASGLCSLLGFWKPGKVWRGFDDGGCVLLGEFLEKAGWVIPNPSESK